MDTGFTSPDPSYDEFSGISVDPLEPLDPRRITEDFGEEEPLDVERDSPTEEHKEPEEPEETEPETREEELLEEATTQRTSNLSSTPEESEDEL